ncbi:MAG: exonuclease SbcCD subunit D C-terminal domain-containing protein [Deltaproteobacteria bacterium]|nr:exonuclease SbcCD subunit D C-terminal domain-containing protein [Deltaproteobacteria bacterium]
MADLFDSLIDKQSLNQPLTDSQKALNPSHKPTEPAALAGTPCSKAPNSTLAKAAIDDSIPLIIYQEQNPKPSLSGPPLRLLHTSDWHLGRSLNRVRRHEEQVKFIDWLIKLIKAENIDVVVVAGDIFDSAAPPVISQELYYRFLTQMIAANLKGVVVVAGNHDSGAFLTAPAPLLRYLRVNVIGEAEDPAEELLTINDSEGRPALLVAAVPFLKDRFVRTSQASETSQDREDSLAQGVRDHYATLATLAKAKQAELGGRIPIVALGHLFAAGGLVTEGDGTRELYVGSLGHVDPEKTLAETFDYVALGHLHRAQKAGRETIRYSGSPLAMSFSETGEKSLTIVDLGAGEIKISLVPIPTFQELIRLKGDQKAILAQILSLKEAGSSAWLEIVYTGSETLINPRAIFETTLKDSNLSLMAIIDERLVREYILTLGPVKSLAETSPLEVFDALLERQKIPEPKRPELKATYQEVLLSLAENQAEPE